MKTIIITGATGAMGWEVAKIMIHRGNTVIATCRNEEKAQKLAAQLSPEELQQLQWMTLNIAERQSIADFVERIAALQTPIDMLFNNAGTLPGQFSVNSEGMEMTYATNYWGTRQLTEQLLPYMAPQGSIVFTSSLSCYFSNRKRCFEPFKGPNYRPLFVYANTKMALTLYAQELAKQQPQLHINCTDPGIVDTPLFHMGKWYDDIASKGLSLFAKRPAQGVVPAVRALDTTLTGHLFRGASRNTYSNNYGYPRMLRP